MSFCEMEYYSVHVLSPDNDPCIILRWPERNRILPVWIEETEAFAIAARDEDEQFGARRPLTHDLLVHALSRIGSPVVELRIVSYHEGVFLCSLVLSDGEEIDCRPSDGIIVARMLGIPVMAEESMLNQVSVFVNETDLEAYLGITVENGEEELSPSASGNPEADADFLRLMADLGVVEDELFRESPSDTLDENMNDSQDQEK
ncbi:bifunctional nuclease family protein [Corynebacterium pseudotuberculosis]|uniref:Bifunctional nuclease family protein n=1 Tax=Corynebacterium pseudotuberculosis (strain C231) TaxID=681645 RepID=D9QA99_CORP2|nr:bifunctional nuclease family protein [Corynebacterium pseudotuberculosis]ADK28796.1 bifunctional nuclease family protein [Corynebacterium pseudotuberculosis FRC41]ADL10475.1 bifunctional nuclease family protein [Corynebacterium pseudotuberculosis C231]ADL20883.1 bifunctional nuclease family protein [Corynebacterium pseudotuberculosis 1002]ADO26272.1 bifunctional nuclease family protein [Corynebacterium pseudotuberculosis I19]AEP70246.1 Hypothetical protein Cp4202_0990 [Corynebacterium pseud